MDILWMTDIHLDYLLPRKRRDFLQSLRQIKPRAAFVGGDISKATRLEDDLRAISTAVNAPVYYVLGNHDYFCSSFATVKESMIRLVQEGNSLCWLESISHINLMENVGLVGHGCWGDAGVGSYWTSELVRDMPDFSEIEDFKALDRLERLHFLRQLGIDAAKHLEKSCRAAAKHHRQVIVLTHVPPFPEVVRHQGEINGSGLPFFCCLAAGKALREVAGSLPLVKFTVLSGHCHHEASAQILPNLEAVVQKAQYHKPTARVLRLEGGILFDKGSLGGDE